MYIASKRVKTTCYITRGFLTASYIIIRPTRQLSLMHGSLIMAANMRKTKTIRYIHIEYNYT